MASRTLGGVVAVVAFFGLAELTQLAQSRIAHAQTPAPNASPNAAPNANGPYPTCTKQPSRGDVDAAHYAYLTGRHSFDEGDYATALTYFKDAYRRDCTKHELLPIIARAYELTQNRSEALLALETFLKRVPPSDPNVDAVKKRIANLKAQGEKATPATSAPSASSPSPSPSSSSPPTSPTSPQGNDPSAMPSASSNANGSATAMPPAPAPAPAHKTSVGPFIVMGAGVAAGVVGAVVLVGGLQKRSDATSQCPTRDPNTGKLSCSNPEQAAEIQRSYDSGTTQATVGGVLLGVGAAALAGGIVWFVLDRSAASSPAAFVSPWLARGEGGAGSAGATFAARF